MTRIPMFQTFNRYYNTYYNTNHEYTGSYNNFVNCNKELFDRWFRGDDFLNLYYMYYGGGLTACITCYKLAGLEIIDEGKDE